jgi:hypothetical protein
MGVTAVLFAAFMVWFVLALSNNPEARSNLGDPVFTIGDAKGVADAIRRDGPLLVADPLRRGRNLVVTHDADTWDVVAVVPEIEAAVELGARVVATAGYRYYRQSAASSPGATASGESRSWPKPSIALTVVLRSASSRLPPTAADSDR